MKWKRNENPSESGSYLVSIFRKREFGDQAFKYVSYYSLENNTWYYYDPFEDDYVPSKEIEGFVAGWTDDVPVLLV